ncbi:hypothetical protein QJS10_CPA01g00374 [Acorus calamus]|uniref:Uncharacterized protein n=1 Tax=Acorus calamus TaxID=4465 RepID=A0AAV9FKP0_ACOCL|nr:hypothetical protein QJS10_CPA01g00374 [Acorus calamus]
MAVQDNTETLSLPFFNPHECVDFMEFFNGSLHQKQHHVLQQPKQQKILNALNEEITKANMKMMELVNYVWKLETEKQLWQRTAWEAEAAVVTLNNALQQLYKRAED